MDCFDHKKPVCPPAQQEQMVEPQNVPTCPNTPITPTGITGVVAEIPVVLAEAAITTEISTLIQFPDPVLELKNAIKKNVKITQCHLVPATSTLFIEGFVRKNIQYATPVGQNPRFVTSNLRSLTIDVPFSCSTVLTFTTPPAGLTPSTVSQFDFFSSIPLPVGNPPSESLLGRNLGLYAQTNTEFLNTELPFCRLISSTIMESDEALDRRPLRRGPFEEGVFTRVREKMMVTFTLKVLQNRQVTIP